MNNIEFENLVSKFLEKAKVVFLKKGVDYDDNINYPTYIILDEKRNTFYLTESATNYENFVTNESENLSSNSNINISLSSSFLQLGKVNKNYTNTIALNNGIDLSSFTRKSAILILKQDLNTLEDFLNKNSIAHQAASLEDITVLFLNESSNDKLVKIYNDNFDDDIQPIYTPKDDVSVEENLEKFNAENQGKTAPIEGENIVSQNDTETKDFISDNLTTNTDINEETKQSFLNDLDLNDDITNDDTTKETTSKNDTSSPIDNDDLDDEELAMLNNLDLDDLLKPMNSIDENEDNHDAVFGHVANEDESLKQNNISHENFSSPIDNSIHDNKDNSKISDKERKKQLKEEKLELKKAKKERDKLKQESIEEKFKKLDIVNNFFAQLSGIIFFLPLFIFNKIFKKILPPFIIYWAVSIITVFLGYLGVFNKILSCIPKPFGSLKETLINNINETISFTTMKKIEGLSSSKDTDLSAAIEIINESLLVLKNQTFVFDYIQNNFLLFYLIATASILMIFPAFRTLGKTLTVFSIIYYFAIPIIYYIQYIFINNIIQDINIQQIAMVSLVSAYIIPTVFSILVFIISYLLVPNSINRKGILP